MQKSVVSRSRRLVNNGWVSQKLAFMFIVLYQLAFNMSVKIAAEAEIKFAYIVRNSFHYS